MTKPMIQTGDEVREMNDAEFAIFQAQEQAAQKVAEQREERTKARAAVLKKLKLTEEELALLFG